MCGIYFSVTRDRPSDPGQLTKGELIARGPDSYKSILCASGDISLTFVSSVLALRGDQVQEQPLYDPASGSVLCWNGEAWKADGATIEGNDSVKVFDLLLKASQATLEDHQHLVVKSLQEIAGPFAFVFYDAPNALVYYGRDRLGRRSLLVHRDKEDSLTLCSVATELFDQQDTEVSTTAVHFIALTGGHITTGELPWPNSAPSINKTSPSHLLESAPSPNSVTEFLRNLTYALMLRTMDIPTHSHGLIHIGYANVAILFSGGLDCTLLARIVHDILPKNETVDLLNVAFENPRSLAVMANSAGSAYEMCPDRVTGRSSLFELRQVCSDRKWRFVAINVPYAESQAHKATIQQLIRPHNTEMDMSIAMALYFAARGVEQPLESPEILDFGTDAYTSRARVLLSGLGADELYGGYARHAAAFSRGEFAALADELDMDFARIGSRNLGRDDRVISHWGKEVRYPYLDEDLVKFSLGLPVWEKCGFRAGKKIPKHYEASSKVSRPEDLEPAKILLRLAMWKLGMFTASSERKRAIQFGARTAKMDKGQGKTKGTDVLVLDS